MPSLGLARKQRCMSCFDSTRLNDGWHAVIIVYVVNGVKVRIPGQIGHCSGFSRTRFRRPFGRSLGVVATVPELIGIGDWAVEAGSSKM